MAVSPVRGNLSEKLPGPLHITLTATPADRPVIGNLLGVDANRVAVSAGAASCVRVIGRLDGILPPDPQSGRDNAVAIYSRGVFGIPVDPAAPITQAHLYGAATLGADDTLAAAPGGGLPLGLIVALNGSTAYIEILGDQA